MRGAEKKAVIQRTPPQNEAEMGGPLKRERAGDQARCWVGLGEEGELLGTGGHGEVQGDLGFGDTEQWSRTVGGGVRARSPLWN